jgi:DNA-binding IclR family transcriptional regulator
MTLGACSIAVPVDAGGRTVASIGVVVPDLGNSQHLVPAMRVAAQGIARGLRLA